jgi:hypothetical protein
MGVYLTLGTAGITLLRIPEYNQIETSLLPGVLLLIIAGSAGGVIASSIPEYKTWEEFTKENLKLLGFETVNYWVWSKIEHSAFWLAVLITTFNMITYAPPN